MLFEFVAGPMPLSIIGATEFVNLLFLHHDLNYVRLQIAIIYVLLVRDPFFLGQIHFQKVQLGRPYAPGNSVWVPGWVVVDLRA